MSKILVYSVFSSLSHFLSNKENRFPAVYTQFLVTKFEKENKKQSQTYSYLFKPKSTS